MLDSLRKILVVAGYSIDTVESGREALGLVQKHTYDFVFTDLKMPEMPGMDVVKGVKHLSPDTDVVVLTGYATIQSAVEAMKHGALDYVEKPFTEDELVDFAKKCLLRRRDRLERWVSATVHVAVGGAAPAHELHLPGGVFVSPGHLWVSIQASGMVRIGIDDFMARFLGPIDRIEPPAAGLRLALHAPLFKVGQGNRHAEFLAPLAGSVHEVNPLLAEDLGVLQADPFGRGWVCALKPEDLARDLESMRIGQAAAAWFGEEVRRLALLLGTGNGADTRLPVGSLERVDDRLWNAFVAGFMQGKK